MNSNSAENPTQLSQQDGEELNKLIQTLELSEGATTIFAIAPEPSPAHPVVKQFQQALKTIAEPFQVEKFHYSDRAFYEFLYSSEKDAAGLTGLGRRLVMIYGLDQLPTDRLVREMDQLNRGRETIAKRNLVLIFWLNKVDFLDEFRSRAPDFWDWRGKVITFQTCPPLNPLLNPYLEWLIAENSYLKISGIMQVNRQVDLFLDRIYVSLQAERRQQVTETSLQVEQQRVSTPRGSERSRIEQGDEVGILYKHKTLDDELIELKTNGIEVITKTVVERVDLDSVVQNHGYSVILGAPGAGKTTLLRYLALHYAKAKRDGLDDVLGGSHEALGDVRLPIFIRIADYAERLEDQPNLSLVEYFQQFYRQWEVAFKTTEITTLCATFSELLLEQMRQSNCLILLDGLDEVFDQESRRRVVQGIDAFVEEFSSPVVGHGAGNKFVITSRIAGYRDVQLSARFQEFTIAEMADAQVAQFLQRWCRAIEEAQQPEANEAQWVRQAEAESGSILQSIGSSEGVKRLTVNPLLLTIVALIHRNGSRLPERRVDLYKLAVKTLTEDWQLGKKLPDAPKLVVKEHEAMELLAPLAYWMHEEKPSGVVTQDEAEQQLAKTLSELNQVAPESTEIQQAVALFLRKVRETTGLFVERAPAVYGFMHLTFEEYFAARHIANNDWAEILQLIRAHWSEPRWEEPILLALGYCSHTPRLIERLVGELFRHLEDYQPRLTDDAIRLKQVNSLEAVLVWTVAGKAPQEISLRDLGAAGRVLAEVDVSAGLRRRLWEKLAITYLLMDVGLNEDTTKEFLRLLRRLDLFNGKSDVADYFKLVAKDLSSSKKIWVRAKVAGLYICSGEAGATLQDCITELANQFDSELFNGIRELVMGLGEEISPSLELTCQDSVGDAEQQGPLHFFVALSYVRAKQYEKAITLFDSLMLPAHDSLNAYIDWSLAVCHQEQENYATADDYYQTCFEQLAPLIEPNSFLMYWRNRGVCQRLHEKWELALDCFQNMLGIARGLEDFEEEALALCHVGQTYQEWGKYETAIPYHEQSRDLYQQLEREKEVGCRWDWLSDCYRDWEKYQQALECQQERLNIHQRLGEESEVASAYYEMGCIYQSWEKYEEAIAHYEQSRDRYQQLEKETSVANLWYWVADCYREWGKYSLALDSEKQNLYIRQQLDDQPGIALAYFQLGYIYQSWGNYEEAIVYYEQSRNCYQQLEEKTNVAGLWYRMADCYCKWGKYDLALTAKQKNLDIHQQLDNQPEIALAYFQSGYIYQSWGKYEEAIFHYEQSRDRYQQLEKNKEVASRWYNLADCYKDWGKYSAALECQQRCLEISQILDDKALIAVTYYQFGRIYQSWGKYEEAIAHYEQSRDRYQRLEKEKDVENLWFHVGDAYKNWGKYDKSIECHQKCLELRRLSEDQSRIALSFYQLGVIYQSWGKYEEAIVHYEQSRYSYQQLEKNKEIASRWYNLADCYKDWGKYSAALECQRKCLEIRQILNDQTLIAVTYYQFGRIYQSWGKYEDAIAHYEQSRDRYKQLDKEVNVANQWDNIADCYREWGKYDLALDAEQQNLTISQELDEQSNVAFAYYRLGYIYQSWCKYKDAISNYAQSRDRYQQLEKQINFSALWSLTASCYREWEKYDLALIAERQNLVILQKLDDQSRIASAFFQLGRIYQAWSKYEEAIDHYGQSRDCYQRLDHETNVADQWNWIASCYREWDKYVLALDASQQNLYIRQKLDDQPNIASAYLQLGRIYQSWGNYEGAIAHYDQSRDRYQHLEKETDVANLWCRIADCYREWGKYELALDAGQQGLAIHQKIDDQSGIAFAYYQLGRIYQPWGKYEEALAYYEKSCDLYQQLEKEVDVANLWFLIAACYRKWGKYDLALEAEQQDLDIRQKRDDQSGIANAYIQLGRVYQFWGKYEEALTYYEQSRDLYQQLEKGTNVANLWLVLGDCYQSWGKYEEAIAYYQQSCDLYEALDFQQGVAYLLSWLASCYRELKDYSTATNYYQRSIENHQAVRNNESTAIRFRQLSNTQRLWAKNSPSDEATALLHQAKQNLQQAMDFDTAGDYRNNLAYDQLSLALLSAEDLRSLPATEDTISERVIHFEQSYTSGFTQFTELGQVVGRADETLKIARVYLEITALENLDQAEALALQSLQTFQAFNRRKLGAEANKLLGEIYLKRATSGQLDATISANQFLTKSLCLYKELTLTQQAEEVAKLLGQ
jgi:tetratricopeptide (TPR) repeat protein